MISIVIEAGFKSHTTSGVLRTSPGVEAASSIHTPVVGTTTMSIADLSTLTTISRVASIPRDGAKRGTALLVITRHQTATPTNVTLPLCMIAVSFGIR